MTFSNALKPFQGNFGYFLCDVLHQERHMTCCHFLNLTLTQGRCLSCKLWTVNILVIEPGPPAPTVPPRGAQRATDSAFISVWWTPDLGFPLLRLFATAVCWPQAVPVWAGNIPIKVKGQTPITFAKNDPNNGFLAHLILLWCDFSKRNTNRK